MKPLVKSLLLAGLIAALTPPSLAQPMAGQGTGGVAPSEDMRAQRQKNMQAHWAQREASLKAQLKITPEQEAAWASFIAAMKPSARRQFPSRNEMAALNTPARLDKFEALRTQRNADMDQRFAAVRTFYAALTPEQQKVFDARTLRPMMRHDGMGPDAMGHGTMGHGAGPLHRH